MTQGQHDVWRTFSLANERVTFSLPQDTLVVNVLKSTQLCADGPTASICVKMFPYPGAKKYVHGVEFPSAAIVKQFEDGEFVVKDATYDTGPVHVRMIYVATSDELISVNASGTTGNDESVKRFLDSISFSGKTPFAAGTVLPNPTRPVERAEKLRSSPLVGEMMNKKCSPRVRVAYNVKESDVPSGYVLPSRYARGPTILRWPTMSYGSVFDQAKLRIRLLYQADGCIGYAWVLDRGRDNYTLDIEALLSSLWGLRFLPAIRDGKFVESSSVFVYGVY
jgi:hypothetical protein